MGQEITTTHFGKRDFQAFEQALRAETETLARWTQQARFSGRLCTGFEIEAWLLDAEGVPAPANKAFLERLDDPMAVPELSLFNIELNCTPRALEGAVFRDYLGSLKALWTQCRGVAAQMGLQVAQIGIPPTLRPEQLSLANMSKVKRYSALNEQILRLRGGAPLRFDIAGAEDSFKEERSDLMFEAATTSLQLHLQLPCAQAPRLVNASIALSAPLVALAANAPFLFGRALWEETRIPLFEQVVNVPNLQGEAGGPAEASPEEQRAYARVGFGAGYAEADLLSFFEENLRRFPVLLPIRQEQAHTLPHLRLHNGTIWRWNRPLLGFDADGRPHWRLEQRVAAAGPSPLDIIANAAFFFGAVLDLAADETPVEGRLPFADARDNFYAAARSGLDAQICAPGGARVPLQSWLLEDLLPRAHRGLANLGVNPEDIHDFLGVIEGRVRSGRTGAAWQRAWVQRHGREWKELVQAYVQRQNGGAPVHEWSL